ncbi:hypothetical protein K2224_14565 [Streptomyces sp. BHT-5-2]|uniref:hypothetical protein n=1 Tax=Streptomyces sp. BHT-5-2 TaxID=2866715 RepID=UPI001C8EF472|nr:hypothetical protein [Streptomyces sp. BHT-5-2]QZL04258.1 hypothetical protein K2224_14565 [Streptomyces sp. BHT-5-2]
MERKNGWTLSEQVGQLRPDGVQRLLNHSDWDENAVRDDIEKMLPGDVESRLELFGLLSDVGKRWSYVRHPEGTEAGKLRIVLVSDESHFEDLKSTFENLLGS